MYRDAVDAERSGGPDAYEVMAHDAGQVGPGADGLLCLPYFAGERTPLNDPEARGVFFGLMFGLGGLGSAFFGWLADRTSVQFIFEVSAFLPLFGMIAAFLPNMQKRK